MKAIKAGVRGGGNGHKDVLVQVTMAGMKHNDQKQLRKKRVI